MSTGPGAPALRINVRPLADPLPLGLFAFGIGMLMLAGQTAGWIPTGEAKQVGLLLASFVFLLEGFSTVFAALARDTLATTVLGLFTTSWLALGLQLVTGKPGAISHAVGFFLLAFAAPIISLAVLAASGKPLIALVLTLSATRAILDGIYQLSGSTGIEHAAGYVAAAIAGVAWYAGTAMALEDIRQRAVLPVMRRGAGAAAMDGDLQPQLDHALGEAGVRSQL
jgi:succinate-acetate transporter protein